MRRAGAVRQRGDPAASSRATSGTPEPPRGPCCVSLWAAPMASHPAAPQGWHAGCRLRLSPGAVSWVMVALGQLCHRPGYLFGSIPIPPPHAALPQVRAEQSRSHLGDGSREERPVLEPQWHGDPLQDGCLSPVLVHRGGWWGRFLRNRSPGAMHPGCTSGAQLLSPPPTLGPSTWGCGCSWPPPAPLRFCPAAGTLP